MVSWDRNRLRICKSWNDRRSLGYNLKLWILRTSYQVILTMIVFPKATGVGKISYANLVTKSLLIGPYWASCCWSHSESFSRCLIILSSAATNIDATLSRSSPRCTSPAPWCGVPIKNIPYVESLIDRCSSKASRRAASEWIRACVCQHSTLLESLTWTSNYTFNNYSSQAVGDEDNGTPLALCDSLAKWPIFWERLGSDTFVNLLLRQRSEIRVLAWS